MHPFPLYDWAVSIFIGFFVVTYWRCTWVLMDIWTCNQPQDASLADGNSFCLLVESTTDPEIAELRVRAARISYAIGIGCLALGVFMIWMGWWVPHNEQQKVTSVVALVRLVAIYILGFSAVNIWRGVWYWADDWILPTNPYQSYWTTSIAGSSLCFLLWGGNSLLAPPAIFFLDGPGMASPPVAVTLLSSHFAVSLAVDEEPPELSLPIKVADLLISFILLPFGVVWYWRGSWMLLDDWFWGFTGSNADINMSLLWSFILAFSMYTITSEPMVGLLDRRIESTFVLSLLGRLRTYLMAWGTVAFWRLVWYIWDQFLGGPSSLSAGVGHVVAILVLTALGCVSSICAPASTMGVDSVPNENAADEPLFSMLPVPHELLHILGVARQPEIQKVSLSKIESDAEIEMGIRQESERDASIDQKKKGLPGRLAEEMLTVDENLPVEELMPSRSQIQRPGEGGEGEEKERVPGMEFSSSRRGWHSDGSFRSYSQLQRFGGSRMRSKYAQRPGMGNKRSRSKFFRSR